MSDFPHERGSDVFTVRERSGITVRTRVDGVEGTDEYRVSYSTFEERSRRDRAL